METCHRFFKGLGSTAENPLLFEDALGVVQILPIEWLRSWDHLRSMIKNHFEDRRGHQKVLRGEYTLEDDVYKVELELMSLPWEVVMKPGSGRKINMVMTFLQAQKGGTDAAGNYDCPGCGLARVGRPSDNLKCDCGMWMRLRQRLRTPSRPRPRLVNTAVNTPSSNDDDDPSHFHRVLFDIYLASSHEPKGASVVRQSLRYRLFPVLYCRHVLTHLSTYIRR
ncbi:hypothetical protein BDP81DRAFT_36346 [Colletotrichum phormii]|uniref:Ubiquitin-like domain-containing protein n=1 Tax=Colletotrichum phormii TaxID=359342 RepID=A0AAI9ZQG0_9PEZI|nr:uncharacterized protein BDP81DRAFT_36346 [Colletotrichum phormii]KAK1636305.1 hypothetical protein BDP81DRAFT_36346 [Colletotrichum phormii]